MSGIAAAHKSAIFERDFGFVREGLVMAMSPLWNPGNVDRPSPSRET
jgi:hypothetical protein